MDYPGILRILGRSDAEVHSALRSGSRVYGTATPTSDEDFVVIFNAGLRSPSAASGARRDAERDLVFRDGVNITTHGLESFRAAIASQSVFALECLFLPPEHRLKDTKPAFPWKLDRVKLAASATSRSESDWKKAGKQFAEEPVPSKKKLFHSLRVPMFALQIARGGRIGDYGEANALFREIQGIASDDWEDFRSVYEPLRARLCAALEALASR